MDARIWGAFADRLSADVQLLRINAAHRRVAVRFAAGVARRHAMTALDSAAPVDASSMVDVYDEHGVRRLVDANEYPIVAPAGGAIALKFIAERFAQPRRIVGQRAGDELDNGRGDFGRQSMQRACGTWIDSDAIAGRLAAHRGGNPNCSRSSSPLTVSPAT